MDNRIWFRPKDEILEFFEDLLNRKRIGEDLTNRKLC